MHRQTRLLLVLTAAATVLILGCPSKPRVGGGGPPDGSSGGSGTIAGIAIKGPLAGAAVHVHTLSGTTRGPSIVDGATDISGNFSVNVGAASGPFLVVVTTGTYVDESTGAIINAGGDELLYLVDTFTQGDSISNLLVTPMSTLAAKLALHWAQAESRSLSSTAGEAWQHVNSHFGFVDFRSVVPTDLTVPDGGAQLDGPATAALVIAGLSQEAKTDAIAAAQTPGGSINPLSLLAQLSLDAEDGYFDGIGASGQLTIPANGTVNATGPSATKLDGDTLRYTLALGIANFLASDRNGSHIHLNDALTLINGISQDGDSRIFKTSGKAFNSQPPSISYAVTYTLPDGGGPLNPVGTVGLVGGTLLLTVDATGPNAIQSLVVTQQDGGLVPNAPQGGGTTTHFVGAWSTLAEHDGPLVFSATAVDVYQHMTNATYSLLVDNTPPQIAVANPADAGVFYSSSLIVDAAATDPNGLSSFVLAGLPNFTDTDSAPAHIFDDYVFPSSVLDGPLVGTFTAFDVVGNELTLPLPLLVDRTAPVVSIVTAPPQYTNQNTVNLVAAANDGDGGSGVHQVYALGFSGAANSIGVRSGGVWNVTNIPLANGANNVLVWADDNAVPANTGFGKTAPQLQQLAVLQDANIPNPTAVAAASFLDERYVTVAMSGTQPIVPVQYQYSQQTSVIVGNNAEVYKVSPRLSWGPTAPTATQLEGANPYNTPWIRFQIPFNATSDSPITHVWFTTSYNCSGCTTTATDTADMIASAFSQSGYVYYDAPIALESMPTLRQVTGSPVTITIQPYAQDAAGNVTQLGSGVLSFHLHILGPPLVVQQDTNYPSSGDSRSVFPYALSNGTYGNLFAGTNGGEIGRAARYIVYNPYPIAVPVSVGPSGSWVAAEEWDTSVFNIGDFNQDNFSFSGHPQWFYWFDCPGQTDSLPFPCGVDTSGSDPGPPSRHPYHLPGSTTQYLCSTNNSIATNHPNPQGNVASGTIGTSQWVLNNESAAPSQFSNAGGSRTLVPPASGSSPGGVVVYFGSPWAPNTGHSYTYQTMGNPDGVNRYYQPNSKQWVYASAIVTGGFCDTGNGFSDAFWQAQNVALLLSHAPWSYTGSLVIQSFGSGPTASSDLEEPTAVFNNSFSQTVTH